MRLISYILFPFSLIYWFWTYCRNLLFDWGVLSQTTFSTPIISIGNITVGGTGKTPHVQYLAQLLHDKKIATVSRGYKRKTKGFILADEKTTVDEIGDEPFQLHQRFPNIHVAVCEKRVVGVSNLLSKIPDIQVILLDDAFQHRYIKPQLQVVLIDYNRPLWDDHVFPMGFLREGKYALSRADVVVITKCPKDLHVDTKQAWIHKLALQNQKIFFSTMEYGALYEYSTKEAHDIQDICTNNSVCVITGIAQPKPLINYIKSFGGVVIEKTYPDHYSYSQNDVDEIQKFADEHVLITTEKDIYKLSTILPETKLYVVPIMPRILFEEQESFNSTFTSLFRTK